MYPHLQSAGAEESRKPLGERIATSRPSAMVVTGSAEPAAVPRCFRAAWSPSAGQAGLRAALDPGDMSGCSQRMEMPEVRKEIEQHPGDSTQRPAP